MSWKNINESEDTMDSYLHDSIYACMETENEFAKLKC